MDLKELKNTEYETQKDLVSKIRSKVSELFRYGNNIERLMKDKVEDFILLQEMPLGVRVGEHTIYIGTFSFSNEDRFWTEWVRILSLIQADKVNFDLLNDSRNLYKALHVHKFLFKELCRMIYKTVVLQQQFIVAGTDKKEFGWKNVTLKYLIDHLNTETLLQICMLIYTYNFDAEKKNLQLVLGYLGGKEREEMYMYSWLRNLGGLTGKFLRAQAPSIERVWADTTNPSSVQTSREKNKEDKDDEETG